MGRAVATKPQKTLSLLFFSSTLSRRSTVLQEDNGTKIERCDV